MRIPGDPLLLTASYGYRGAPQGRWHCSSSRECAALSPTHEPGGVVSNGLSRETCGLYPEDRCSRARGLLPPRPGPSPSIRFTNVGASRSPEVAASATEEQRSKDGAQRGKMGPSTQARRTPTPFEGTRPRRTLGLISSQAFPERRTVVPAAWPPQAPTVVY